MNEATWEDYQKSYKESQPHKGMKEVLDAHLAKMKKENAPVEEIGVPEKE